MYNIFSIYTLLKNGQELSATDIKNLIEDNNILIEQWSSLSALLAVKENRNIEEEYLFAYSIKLTSNPTSWYDMVNIESKFRNEYEEAIYKTIHNKPLGKSLIYWIMNEYDNNNIDIRFFSFWLMLLNVRELSQEDTFYLTTVLLESGEIIEYKTKSDNISSYFTRRYPTGGLSEKIALILPSLLAATRDIVDVKSNFLVAKTLSHTGGTVDKLSVIKGFNVPQTKKSIQQILNEFGIVMSSTGGLVAPLDEKLYTFRSMSGTVEAKSLIISSIASKQLALPTDYLVIDVRYGSGAFIKNEIDAIQIGEQLSNIFEKYSQKNDYFITSIEEPNGSAIGNVLEVIEAIEIMNPQYRTDLFDEKFKTTQENLVLSFYSNIMGYYDDTKNWLEIGADLLKQGKVIEEFYKLLSYHGVSDGDLKKIKENILIFFDIESLHTYEIKNSSNGILDTINQKKLGYVINYEINYDAISKAKVLNGGGIVINKLLGERVKKGELLATLYSRKKMPDKILNDIESCFFITKENEDE